MQTSVTSPKQALLGDLRLRRELMEMVRRRVHAEEAEDVVQATLTDALASTTAPENLEELRRWVWGIARHKIADHHRKHRREEPTETGEIDATSQDDAPETNDLLRWAERELPEGQSAQQTLEWLLREGEGEKLEHIAASENLPAPRVRQRVTRLRQHFRARWQAQLVAVATLVGAGILLWWWLRPTPVPEAPIAPEGPRMVPSVIDPSLERARELRRVALEACKGGENERCLRLLDEAAGLDPRGDSLPEVVEARRAAAPPSKATPVPSGNTLNQPEPKDSKKMEDSKKSKAPSTPKPAYPSASTSPTSAFDSGPGLMTGMGTKGAPRKRSEKMGPDSSK